ncbi:MAG: signal peptidase II [Candidatus Bipolaricaulota bacterium]|nr:signal peptidase II [Candidatus Bipolaricaulota bacterium]
MLAAAFVTLAAVLLALDRITKAWATSTLALGDPHPLIGNVIRLTRVHNSGGAFGVLAGKPALFIAVSMVIAVAAVVAFVVLHGRRPFLRLALVFVFVGAVGNLIDRLTIGYVVDFFEVVGFPVFNVADSCVTVGAIFLVLYALVGGGRPSTSPKS